VSVISKNLQDVVDAFRDEVTEIEQVFCLSAGATSVSSRVVDYDPRDDGCVVSLWDSWNRFMRGLILSCASTQVIGTSGRIYAPARVQSEAQTVVLLVRASKSRSNSIRAMAGEPSWYDQRGLADVVNELRLSNGQQIVMSVTSSSVSLGEGFLASNPIEEVRTVRNFIAHKNDATLARARTYMTGHVTNHTHELMVGGVSRFRQWVDTFVAIAETAAV